MALYLTDSWSSISGLASVSYGDPSRYPEVANQVIQKSPLANVVNGMTPGAILGDKITTEKVKESLEDDPGFSQYLDTSRKSIDTLAMEFKNLILESFEQISGYESSLSKVIKYAGLPGISSPESLANSLTKKIPDLDIYTSLALSVPGKKPDKLPAGEKIDISESVNLGLDHNGVSLTTGYLVPEKYFTGTAIPGMGITGDNLPNSMVDSLVQGFANYGSLELLDNIFGTNLSATISREDIGSLKNVARSVAGVGTIGAIKDISSIGALSPEDQAMYDVDLTNIVLESNGYTVYDPGIDSNGDYFDTTLIPDYEAENSDPGNGLPYSQRIRSGAF